MCRREVFARGLVMALMVGLMILPLYGTILLTEGTTSASSSKSPPQVFYLGNQLIDITVLNITNEDKIKVLNLINNINKEENALVLLTLAEDGTPQVNLILLPGLDDERYGVLERNANIIANIIHGTVNVVDLRSAQLTPIENESMIINITNKIYNIIESKNFNISELTIAVNINKNILIIIITLPENIIYNNNIKNLLTNIAEAYTEALTGRTNPLLIITANEETPFMRVESLNATVSLEPVETLPSPTPPAPQEIGPPLILPVALALAAGLLIALFRIV